MGKDAKARNPGNIVVVGGGIVGVCTAYFLAISPHRPKGSSITLVEANAVACAASGNAGGFLARDWHPTETASELTFLTPSPPSSSSAPTVTSAINARQVTCGLPEFMERIDPTSKIVVRHPSALGLSHQSPWPRKVQNSNAAEKTADTIQACLL